MRLGKVSDLSVVFMCSIVSSKSFWTQSSRFKVKDFFKSVLFKEKHEACLSFVVKIFTKYLHRGGVTYHESTENQRKLAQSQHFSTFGVHKNAKDTNRFWRGLSPFSFARVYENAQKSLWAWNEMIDSQLIVSKRISSSLHIEHIKTGIYFTLLYLLINSHSTRNMVL